METDKVSSEASRALQKAFANHKKQNPSASLRGVAAKLKISPSYWSKILKGQKNLPAELIPKILAVLKMDEQQTQELQLAILGDVNQKLARKTGVKTLRSPKTQTEDFSLLGKNEFWLLEDWYYLPLLNLVALKEFVPETSWISQRLGLPLDRTRSALERLIHQGFLVRTDEGRLERMEMKLRFPTTRSHASVRAYHHAMIQKAAKVLVSDTAERGFDDRLISSISFAGSSQHIKEARALLEEALYKAAQLMAASDSCDEVFQLNLQFFPVTKKGK